MDGRGEAVVVTGAASGIGEAIARVLVERGWWVVGLDRDGGGLERLAADLGARFAPVTGDVGRSELIMNGPGTRRSGWVG